MSSLWGNIKPITKNTKQRAKLGRQTWCCQIKTFLSYNYTRLCVAAFVPQWCLHSCIIPLQNICMEGCWYFSSTISNLSHGEGKKKQLPFCSTTWVYPWMHFITKLLIWNLFYTQNGFVNLPVACQKQGPRGAKQRMWHHGNEVQRYFCKKWNVEKQSTRNFCVVMSKKCYWNVYLVSYFVRNSRILDITCF